MAVRINLLPLANYPDRRKDVVGYQERNEADTIYFEDNEIIISCNKPLILRKNTQLNWWNGKTQSQTLNFYD
jgi:hypothetical protein